MITSPRGTVVWITGRPASGKSTFAATLRAAVLARGLSCAVLDSDAVREALGAHDYSESGRHDFYQSLGSLAALLARQDLIVLVPATAHRRAYREAARARAPRFLEVFVSTPLEECARRDPKGLYARARSQHLELPTADYEPPAQPDVVATGGHDERAVADVLVALAR
ncbi:MAG: adenylyl-sulfate kinase [Archangium sp.]|nr:adenylyl-sulfate kinase [Archangium sp.]